MDGFYDDFLKTSGNENILMCVVECTFKHEIYDIFNLFWFLIDLFVNLLIWVYIVKMAQGNRFCVVFAFETEDSI